MKLVAIALAVIALAGCANQTQTGTAYTAGQSRQAQTVQRGTVTEVKNIDIAARPSGVGALAGTALGGIAGSTNGTGNKSAATAIVGMVVGGIAGSAIDRNVATLKGQEITVVLTNGAEIAVAQEIDEKEGPFIVGERVRVLSGAGSTRVSR